MYSKLKSAISKNLSIGFIILLGVGVLSLGNAMADNSAANQTSGSNNPGQTTGPSGLPLPRFVTLKANRVNMRVGPNQQKYPIKWSYQRRGLPVEIIQEYGNWRRIRDYDGADGWVNAALLSSKRGAFIAPGQKSGMVNLYEDNDVKSKVVIKAEPGVIGQVIKCDGHWCKLKVENREGYIYQKLLWGVFPNELVDN